MFVINKDDLSICLTRGDAASITLPITHSFQANDVVRFQVFKKKDCADIVLRKDFVVPEATESITIELDGSETKLGGIINKPTDFWYEVEVNPGETSETIIGYDEDGAKVFRLFPEGNDEIITYEEFANSAYTIAVAHGYEGTKGEWLDSLKGEKGDKGDKGDRGEQGEKGDKGDKGDDAIVDQSYNPESENAQSGVAVAKAVSDVKEISRNDFANALKGTASGEIVSIKDISPIEHELKVNVKSKNLFPNFITDKTYTNGSFVKVNEDGSITVHKVAGDTINIYLKVFIEGAVYTLSNGLGKGRDVYVQIGDNSTSLAGSRTFMLQSGEYNLVLFASSSVALTEDVTLYPQLEKGTTATEYTPYIEDLNTVSIKRCGKNLLPYPYHDSAKTENGLVYTVNEDNSITLDGTSPINHYFKLISSGANNYAPIPPQFKKGEKYTMSTTNVLPAGGEAAFGVYFYRTDGTLSTTYTLYRAAVLTITIPTDAESMFAFIRIAEGAIFDNFTIYPQIELGSVNTQYEPYVEAVTANVEADGTVKGINSIYPTTTLTTDTVGALVDVEYNKDINKAFAELQQAIISLGGNV